MTATESKHDLVDIIDLQPAPGEYVGCKHPMTPHEIYGVMVDAWHPCHAARRAVSERWSGNCECCGHHLRYAHVTVDAAGEYHCFGRTCLSIEGIGEEATRKLEYSEKIEQKKSGGFCATFNAPQKFWDMPREIRPTFARPWKGKSFSRSNRTVWKLSVWGDSFEDCLAHCMDLSQQLGGVKLN